MKIKHLTPVLVLVSLLLATSCEKDYLNINTDPNNLADAEVQIVLPVGQVASADILASSAYHSTTSFWVQYWTQAGNIAGASGSDQYVVQPGSNAVNNQFTAMFAGALRDLKYVSDKAFVEGKFNHFAIAEFVTAYDYQLMVDLYDKVPYFEALKGVRNLSPKYDEGSAIYADLILKIDAALAVIDTDLEAPTGDLIFKGNMDKWIKFANTLKLKIYLRQSQVDGGNIAKAGIATLGSAKFLGAGEDAEIQYAATPTNNRHPLFGESPSQTPSYTVASNTIIQYLQGNSDPRIDYFFRRPINPVGGLNAHRGIDQGTSSSVNQNAAFFSVPSASVIGETAAFPFISAAESLFLQAEAVQRGWLAGNAKSLYEQAITASFIECGLTAEQAADYYESELISYPEGDKALESILMEKWVSMCGKQGVEAFAEWRRTGFPGLDFIKPTPINVTGDKFPQRFPFTTREASENISTPDVVAITTPVWWDK